MTDQLVHIGTLSTITGRTTRQGRPWATAVLTHDGGENELQIYPDAFEAVGGHLADGAEVSVGIRPPATVTTLTVAGHQWTEPTSEDRAAADNRARREIHAYLTGLGIPSGPAIEAGK